MYFGLGALLTGIVALLFLPLFWRRAVRLSTRSLEMRLPLSMTEIVAERDQLRAEFAVQRRQVEKRAEDALNARSRDMVELGQRAKHIANLEAEILEVWRESEARAARLATLGGELANAQTELGVVHQSHWDAEGRLANKTADHAELQDHHQAALAQVDEYRASMAALETRIVGHEASAEDLRRANERATLENLELSRVVLALDEQRAAASATSEATAARRDQALAQFKEAQEKAEEMSQRHRDERRARLRLESELASQNAALALAESREASLRDSHADAWAAMKSADAEQRQRFEVLVAENGSLRGALQAARDDAARLRGARSVPSPRSPVNNKPVNNMDADESLALRRAISEIGSKVEHMMDAVNRSDERPRAANSDEPMRAGAAE